uniref:(northern house mosquito) hypothetical protein n=1 Tax=Culex pipiens TaxID=7175 RepID=A0A8D8FKU4_CULPI
MVYLFGQEEEGDHEEHRPDHRGQDARLRQHRVDQLPRIGDEDDCQRSPGKGARRREERAGGVCVRGAWQDPGGRRTERVHRAGRRVQDLSAAGGHRELAV